MQLPPETYTLILPPNDKMVQCPSETTPELRSCELAWEKSGRSFVPLWNDLPNEYEAYRELMNCSCKKARTVNANVKKTLFLFFSELFFLFLYVHDRMIKAKYMLVCKRNA